MVMSFGKSNLYFFTAISKNSYGFSAIILFISLLNFKLWNLCAALLRALISRSASFMASVEASASSTLEEREFGRGETCCLGEAWDLTGGDTMDREAGKAGGLIRALGDVCDEGDISGLGDVRDGPGGAGGGDGPVGVEGREAACCWRMRRTACKTL